MKIANKRYILDSFALLAHLQDEPGKSQVEAILREAERKAVEIFMPVINLGEVGYIIERRKGLATVQAVIAVIDHLPVTIIDADRQLTFLAAHIKAHYPISYADAFAVALAQLKKGAILTGDPEFRKVEEIVPIEWLSQP